MPDLKQEPSAIRDQSLRTVELPDCCGNCRYWRLGSGGYCGVEHYMLTAMVRVEKPTTTAANQVCDLHERRAK